MKARILFVFTVALILCFALIQSLAWSKTICDLRFTISDFGKIPQSDIQTGRWKLGSREVTLSAPQGVRFASPVYWEDLGSQPIIWAQEFGSDRPVELFLEPSPDAQVNVIVQLVGEPVLAVRRQLQQEGRLTASTLHRQRADLLASQADFLSDLQAAGIQAQLRRQYTTLIHGLALTLRQADVDRLAERPGVRGVFPDYQVHALQPPNVEQIGAPSVWEMRDPEGRPVHGTGIRVAVLDTGIDYTHPDLGGGGFPNDKVIGGYDFLDPDRPPFDNQGHGTHVAGIIAADGTLLGVAPEAQLLAYKVLDASGKGKDSDVIAALEMAVDPDGDPATDDGAHVINLSLGGGGSPFDPLSQAVNAAVEAGAVVAVAAGNYGWHWETVESPGCAARAITVGAVDSADERAYFSGRGPVPQNWTIKPDLMAPGVSISSTMPGGYQVKSGTSMAAPHVAGAAALLRQLHPDWMPDQVKGALMGTALNLGLSAYAQGAGRVQVDQAATAPAAFTPSSISLGLDDLTQNLWSPSHILHLTNLATETTTYTLHMSGDPSSPSGHGLPAGVDALFQPATLTLRPGETGDFLFTLTVDNGRVANVAEAPYAYQGWIVAVGGSQEVRAPLAFIKCPQLHLEFDILPTSILVHDGQGFHETVHPGNANRASLLVPAGTYDVAAVWSEHIVVVRADMAVETETFVRLDPAQAEHRFEIVPTGITGDPVPVNVSIADFSVPSAHWSVLLGKWGDEVPTTTYCSDMSDEYQWGQGLLLQQEEGVNYVFSGGFRGITKSLTIETSPEDLIPAVYTPRLGTDLESPILQEGLFVQTPSGRFGLSEDFPAWPGQVRPYYHAPSQPADLLFGLLAWAVGELSEEDELDLAFMSPFYHAMVSPPGLAVLDRDDPTATLAELPAGETIPLGLGPAAWQARFDNEASTVHLTPIEGHKLWPFIGPLGDRFHPKGLPYRIEQDGQVLLAGNFPASQWNEYGIAPRELEVSLPITVTGVITFHTGLDYAVGTETLIGQAQVGATFDPAAEDPNPPALTAFQVLAEGVPTDQAAGPVQVRFVVSDTAEVASVLLEADWGEGYVPYPQDPPYGEHVVNLPAARPGSQVGLRLTAEDTAANRLIYQAGPAYVAPPVRLYFPLVLKDAVTTKF